jgi:hypothetical protein
LFSLCHLSLAVSLLSCTLELPLPFSCTRTLLLISLAAQDPLQSMLKVRWVNENEKSSSPGSSRDAIIIAHLSRSAYAHACSLLLQLNIFCRLFWIVILSGVPIHDIPQTFSTRNTTHATTRCRNPISIYYTLPARSLHDSLHTAHFLYTLTTRGHYTWALFTTRNHYIPEPAFTTRPSPAHYTMESCSEKSCHYMWVRKCCVCG